MERTKDIEKAKLLIKQRKKLLKDMGKAAFSVNKHLKDVVKDMGFHELRANCHPRDRDAFDRRHKVLNENYDF